MQEGIVWRIFCNAERLTAVSEVHNYQGGPIMLCGVMYLVGRTEFVFLVRSLIGFQLCRLCLSEVAIAVSWSLMSYCLGCI